jgi:ABC-type transport system involved in cytochrome c biogenesis permease subunit
MGTFLFELALFFYLAATIIGIIELFKGRKITSNIMFFLVGVGFSLHTANIICRYVEAGHIPITNFHESTSFFSWSIILIFFLL